jgi:3-phenylpropionate/trans-cinnamate dioxygenase ferredoxin reductase subunit
MADSEWTKVGAEAEIREGAIHECSVGDDDVLVTRHRGSICACGATCPHYGAPLASGVVSEGEIVCPWHNARFKVEDGSLSAPPALDDLPTYEVKIEDGSVYLGARRAPAITMPEGHDGRCFAIVGGGAAGNAAAEGLRRRGFAGHIVLITAEAELPYDRTMLSKGFLAGKSDSGDLPLRSEDFYERLQVEIRTNHTVTSVDTAPMAIGFAKGVSLKADAVLLATGCRPKRLAGLDRRNCFALRSAADAVELRKAADALPTSDRRVVILGAGFIGMEAAASFRQQDYEVHLVAPEAEPMAHAFGEPIGRRLRRLHEEKGVQLHLNTSVQRIDGNEEVHAVVLSDGATLPTPLLLYAVGVEPVTDFVAGLKKAEDGGILVDRTFATSAPGIYAAGDIASVPYLGGDRVRVEHWVEAERQGMHAAGNMLGDTTPYGGIPFFWTRQYDESLKFIGLPLAPGAVAYRGDVDGGDFVAGFYSEQGELTGAAASGRDDELLLVERLLHERRPLPLADFATSPLWEQQR